MEFITTLISLFGGAASGGLMGAVSGLIGKFFEHRRELAIAQVELERYKIQTAHDQVMAEKNNETLKLEIDGNLRLATTEAESTALVASYDALKASYDNDTATYATGDKAKNSKLFIYVDFLRGITRPLLTWCLTLSMFSITFYLLYILKDQLPTLAKEEGISLLEYTVHSVAFLASTSVTYWFASRTTAQK